MNEKEVSYITDVLHKKSEDRNIYCILPAVDWMAYSISHKLQYGAELCENMHQVWYKTSTHHRQHKYKINFIPPRYSDGHFLSSQL